MFDDLATGAGMAISAGPDQIRSDDSVRQAALVALRELTLAVEGFRTTVAHYFGIGTTESQAISYLVARGELGQTELALALGITTSAATSLIDRLESNGYAERRPHPDDRRRMTVRLAARGQALVDQAQDWFRGAFDGIPLAELPAATQILGSVAEHLRHKVELVATSTRHD
jgi:DNA-binding MarR family transcriptional regulator